MNMHIFCQKGQRESVRDCQSSAQATRQQIFSYIQVYVHNIGVHMYVRIYVDDQKSRFDGSNCQTTWPHLN